MKLKPSEVAAELRRFPTPLELAQIACRLEGSTEEKALEALRLYWECVTTVKVAREFRPNEYATNAMKNNRHNNFKLKPGKKLVHISKCFVDEALEKGNVTAETGKLLKLAFYLGADTILMLLRIGAPLKELREEVDEEHVRFPWAKP